MPTPRPQLRPVDVEHHVREQCFAPAQGGLVGIELERHLVPAGGATAPPDHAAVARAAASVSPLPGGSRVTFEPGGQLEVSSPPRPGPAAACAVLGEDLAVVDPEIERLGVDLTASGLHPHGHDQLMAAGPRYEAMATYFDRTGPCGRTMMCGTAALQLNLDIGHEGSQAQRWRLAHDLGPVLVAAFANSPVAAGPHRGWRSGRSAAWSGIDPTRTRPADSDASDPAAAWLRYAVAARVMMIRLSPERVEPVLSPLPFARWLDQGHELGFPTIDDLAYHLGTLFPPVRARGWLELRMLDALPHPWWAVAASVAAALLDDPEASERAGRATTATRNLWVEAGRHGLAHPALARAARSCFAAALDALPRLAADAATVAHVAAFCERFVDRGRCPADETIDAWRAPGHERVRPLEATWT